MRRRAFAAAAVVAWSKTAVGVPVALATVVEQPAAAQVSATVVAAVEQPAARQVSGTVAAAVDCSATFGGHGIDLVSPVFLTWSKSACPGTLDVRASSDNQQWKSIGSQHSDPDLTARVGANCLPGTWWYKGVFVSDDHSSVSITPGRQATGRDLGSGLVCDFLP